MSLGRKYTEAPRQPPLPRCRPGVGNLLQCTVQARNSYRCHIHIVAVLIVQGMLAVLPVRAEMLKLKSR